MRTKRELNADMAAFGVEYAKKELNLSEVNVGFRPVANFNSIEEPAMYNSTINCIIFNIDWLDSADHEDILYISFISTHDAFKYDCLKNPKKYKVNTETIRNWKRDFNSILTDKDDAYFELSTVKDGLDFAQTLMYKLVNELESDAKKQGLI